MKPQYTAVINLTCSLCLCPLQKEVVVYAHPHFSNVSLSWRLFFSVCEQPYLVQSMLIACSYYTLLLKEVKDKRHHICFGVRNSQVLWVGFFFAFFPPRKRNKRIHITNNTRFPFLGSETKCTFYE